MKTPRFFFRIDSDYEFCHNLKYFKEKIKEEYDEIPFEIPIHFMLSEAIISFGDGTFYCDEYGEVGLICDSECGSGCKKYSPRNGRSGRCIHSKHCYEPGSRVFELAMNNMGKIKLIERTK